MGGIFLIILWALGLITGAIGLFIRITDTHSQEGLYALWIGVSVFVFFFMCFLFTTFVVIDAGEVGVEVLFGKVQENTLTEGWNGKSPFSDVYTYSVRLKEYTMSVAKGEGAKKDADGVDVRTIDNSKMVVDATVVWSIDPAKAFDIYRKVSKNEENLVSVIIRPNVRNIMRDVGARYTLDNLMKEREAYGKQVVLELIEAIQGKGIIIDNVLIRDISPPVEVDIAIQNKLSAEQELKQKEFELEKAKKDAQIQIVQAQGIADSQDIIQQKLTPLYVQYLAVENYKVMANSPNTTFIIAPTSPTSSGMPLILNAK